MSYHWEPQWVRKVFVFDGIEIETCVDLNTGLIVCPLCVDIDKLCPKDKPVSYTQPSNIASYFFTVEDLYRHLKAHQEAAWRTALEFEEAEEESVEEEEEEEG